MKNGIGLGGLMVGLATLAGCGENNAMAANETKELVPGVSESVTTNANGSVTRTRTESSVEKKNGMVTERKRVTSTTTDAEGNVIGESSSEYVASRSGEIAEEPAKAAEEPSVAENPEEKPAAEAVDNDRVDSFLGVKFGSEMEAKDAAACAGDPTLQCVKFTPAKPLAGFDDYYAYLTPKTHRVVKICACSKQGIPPAGSWRRHYLIEALEKRYGVWAMLCSWTRPYYRFDVAPGKVVTACLAGASEDYAAVISAWDENLVDAAADEWGALREEARKAAAAKRATEVRAAQDAF